MTWKGGYFGHTKVVSTIFGVLYALNGGFGIPK